MTSNLAPRPRSPRRPPSAAVYHRRRAVLLLFVSVVLLVFAATRAPAATADPHPAVMDLSKVADNITGWVVGILAAVATMFLTIGGLRYVMAGGDAGEVEKAKSSLKSAMYGYGLAMLAPAVVQVLQTIVTKS
ncbi:Na+/H+ antiporter NhaC [Catenulispora sp. EB89]|uniref:pilin n=1 Tax=Catenulispora sp. EB89 TaxID=3156257 RepID=UPI0035136224